MIRTGSLPYLALALGAGSLVPLVVLVSASRSPGGPAGSEWEERVEAHAAELVAEGRRAFRHGPAADEELLSAALRLELALSKLVPAELLALGLKLDSEALSNRFVADLRKQQVDLESPATMMELLRSQAIVGVTASFDATGRLSAVGLQCALCHSTVDDAVAPGIGRRLDGWANRDLDAGALLALAPELAPLAELLGTDEASVRARLRSFGPGRFDDGLGSAAADDDGATEATAPALIPPVFGLAGSGRSASTHWDDFVARLVEGVDDSSIRANVASGRAADARGALHAYQLALPAPEPPPGSYDLDAAARGGALFLGRAGCAECHPPPLLGEPVRGTPDAPRAPPLRGLWTHADGGFYRDGRFASLHQVVEHYDAAHALALDADERADLVEYLRSL
jgi:mono/diheme cytochrome c family protein